MKRIGRLTAALLLIGTGGIVIADNWLHTDYLSQAVHWWPALIIVLGVEYLIVALFNHKDAGQTRLAFGSLATAIIISFAVIAFSNASSFTDFVNIQGYKFD